MCGAVLYSELGLPNSTDFLSKTFLHNFQELQEILVFASPIPI